MVNTEKEIWKPYPEYPFIEANQFGEVRTRDRVVTCKNGRKYHVKGRILKQQLHRDGYPYVVFRANGKFINLSVHRIVATAFIPNPNNLPEVNHIDCNRANNIVSNLEWCTSSYNRQYTEKYGKAFGRPVIAIKIETKEVLLFKSQHEASRQLGASQGNINSVIKGHLKKTYGYWFCYADENTVEKTREKFGDVVANEVG